MKLKTKLILMSIAYVLMLLISRRINIYTLFAWLPIALLASRFGGLSIKIGAINTISVIMYIIYVIFTLATHKMTLLVFLVTLIYNVTIFLFVKNESKYIYYEEEEHNVQD